MNVSKITTLCFSVVFISVGVFGCSKEEKAAAPKEPAKTSKKADPSIPKPDIKPDKEVAGLKAKDPLQSTVDWLTQAGIKRGSQPYTKATIMKTISLNLGNKEKITDSSLVNLANLPQLERLDLGGGQSKNKLTNACLEYLKPLVKLKGLRLTVNKKFGNEGMKHLAGLLSLEDLNLDGTTVGNAGMAELTALKNLKRLYLGSLKDFNGDGLVHLKEFTKLEKLSLQGSGIDDKGLANLKHVPGVKELSLGHLNIDEGLQHLAVLKDLTSLDLFNAKVTDKGAKHLSKLKTLTKLFLWGTQISDKGLANITGLKKITTLYISDTKITDKGMASIAKLPALDYLWINNLPISDAGLAKLGGLKKLKTIQARGTKITEAGVKKLQKKLPSIRVSIK